jgi:uncharacterized protein (DUF2147 family)
MFKFKIMKKIQILGIFMLFSMFTFGQNTNNALLGKWLTKDKVVVEIYQTGKTMTLKQISANNAKDSRDNGKILGKNLVASSNTNEFLGTMIDPSNGKEYQSKINIAGDKKSLNLQVKWGFINFNETWSKL